MLQLFKGKLRKIVLVAAVAGLPAIVEAGGRWDKDRGDRYDDDRDRKSSKVDVRIDIDVGRDRRGDDDCYEKRVWVEPVYRTVCDRVWIEAEYRTVCDRVWHEPVYEERCERVWVPDRYEIRECNYWDGRKWRVRSERVCVEPGHYEDRPVRVCVREGYWENVERRVVVCEGHWKTIERRELVSAGYWTTRSVRDGRDDGRYASADRGERYRD